MKNKIFNLYVSLLIAGAMLTSCQSSTNSSAEKTKEETQVLTSESDYQKFKKESEEKIAAYEKKITELKGELANQKTDTRTKNEKRLAELELKKNELRAKLNNYKDEGMDKWSEFSDEFNRDMNELGKSIADLTRNNVK